MKLLIPPMRAPSLGRMRVLRLAPGETMQTQWLETTSVVSALAPLRRNLTIMMESKTMNIALAALVVVSVAVSACASTMAIAPGPTSDKVYVTKTHTFLIFSSSETRLCDSGGSSISGCQPVAVQ